LIAGGDSINYWNHNTYIGGEKEKTTLFGGGVRVIWWSVSDHISIAPEVLSSITYPDVRKLCTAFSLVFLLFS
jgi:hypothetical protein